MRAVSLFKTEPVSWHAAEKKGAWGKDRSIEKNGSKINGMKRRGKRRMATEGKKAQEG